MVVMSACEIHSHQSRIHVAYKLECEPSTQKYLMIMKSEMNFKACSVNIA